MIVICLSDACNERSAGIWSFWNKFFAEKIIVDYLGYDKQISCISFGISYN